MKNDSNIKRKKQSDELKFESNSSSLNSFEEIINLEYTNNEKPKKNKLNKNIFTNFIKNDQSWKNIIKINTDTTKIKKQKNKSMFVDIFSQNNYYPKQIKNNGKMTPSLKGKNSYFQSKFGRINLTEMGNTSKSNRKSCKILSSINDNSINRYYLILKEINKLIKFANNAQQIFSKKKVKINLNTIENKLILNSKKKTIKKKTIKKKSNLKKIQKFHKDIIKNIEKDEENKNNSNLFNINETNNNNPPLIEEENEFQESEINIMDLIVQIFKKPSGLRNKDELFFIEHYLMTFENVMKILHQKKIGSAVDDLAKKIARYMQIDIIPKDTLICKLGDDGDKFYVIFQGSVAILIPKETNAKMDINEYINHLKKLFSLGEYELALKTIESNLHVFKNKEIIYLKSDIEKYLYLPEYMNYKRENLSIEQYMKRIEFHDNNENNIDNNFEANNDENSSLSHLNIKNILWKNIKQANYNNQQIIKKTSSLTYNKNIEIKKKVSFSSNMNNNFENNNKIIYRKAKFSSTILTHPKIEKNDLNINVGKNNKNNNLNNTYDDTENKSINRSRKTTQKVLSQDNNSILNINKNSEENNYKDNTNNKKYKIILWSYFHVTSLIDGQIFGDVALSENNKRRTATIITQENTICGTLDNQIYNKFIKDAQKRIRKNIVHLLLNINFFNDINEDIFEENYLNMFKYDSIHRNDYLFKSGEERNSIYIVVSGEIEVSITCSIKQLNKILKLKNVILNEAIQFEERLCEINKNFNHFYIKSQNIYRIKIHSFGSCVGLNEYIVPKKEKENLEKIKLKDVFYVNAKCISDKAEVYSIDYKLLNNIFKSEKKEKKFQELILNSEKQTLLRIIEIKRNAILERFGNLGDKAYLDKYLHLANNNEETKTNKDDDSMINHYVNNTVMENKEKRKKSLNIVINNINSSLVNNIKFRFKNRNESIIKGRINNINMINHTKSNSSFRSSKSIFDNILDDFEKEKTKEIDKIKSNNKYNKYNIINNKKNIIIKNNKRYSNSYSNKKEKFQYIKDIKKDNINKNLNLTLQKTRTTSENSKEKTKYKLSNINLQFGKLSEKKDININKNYNSLQNKSKSKKNILNKNNKSIILYPILLKKKRENNLKMMSTKQKDKNKYMKKNLTQNEILKQNQDKNVNKGRKTIFSLILSGLPNFNNKFINKNIRKIFEKCENFKNAKLIDKNLLKLDKGKSFFYKGCESLLTMNNNSNNNNIHIIDLLKYDELYEKKYGFKKRNNSAINKPSISLSKLN